MKHMKKNIADKAMVALWLVGLVMLMVNPIWTPLLWAWPAGQATGDAIANLIESND